MTATTITERAEAACNLLFRTLGAHRVIVAGISPRPTRRRLLGTDDDREQIQCQATLLRLVSITESFCADRLVDEVELVMNPSRGAAVLKVWQEAVVKATSKWDEQKRSYRDWLGVEMAWNKVEVLADARNSVAHGLGSLTRQQLLRERSIRDRLKGAGMSFAGNRIVLTDGALEAAARACRDHIVTLDLAVQNRPAEFR
ncbi:hypothetical protein ACPPVS_02555 [Cellulomonas sp. McL0617]|uniref:hypothetical protein n=1 Tax=Cellulomonas sp. McL0617 TaxID=3415675 RepID=UPI003CF9FC2E